VTDVVSVRASARYAALKPVTGSSPVCVFERTGTTVSASPRSMSVVARVMTPFTETFTRRCEEREPSASLHEIRCIAA
jgi:hypothetical protein